MQIANVLKTPSEAIDRVSILLWGKAGCGKTTFAATAPAPLLWINFDIDGIASLAGRTDVHVLDLSSEPDNVVQQFRVADPLGIGKQLLADDTFSTVVLDSVTSFGDRALRAGVEAAKLTDKGRKENVSLEEPGYSGYGHKNTWVQACVQRMLRLTALYNKHFILIAHEDKPDTDRKGNVMSVSILLGGTLRQIIPNDFGEVWFMRDTGTNRRVYVRPHPPYEPMKTRMFNVGDKRVNFVVNDETGIATLYDAWKTKGAKIELP